MILDLLLIGLAITLEPFPLTAFILLLSAEKGTIKGLAFILGWLACLVAVVAAVLLTTGQMAAVSTSAVALMKGVMKAMLLKRLRFVAYGIVVSAALGLVSLCYPADDTTMP